MRFGLAALADALGAAQVSGARDENVAVTSVSHDSRNVTPGALYCCVRGSHFDGHDFAADAASKGASALLVERRVDVAVPQLLVPRVRLAMGPAASLILGEPSKKLDVIGVTGTNGKTTTVHLLGSILRRDGRLVETHGTLTGARTTPEAPELQERLADAVDRGVRFVAMEVSSHALDLHRVDGTRFSVAIFTNLGHDHLDHHGDLERYFEAKARLFSSAFTAVAVINVDDPYGLRLADETDRTGDVEVVRVSSSDAVGLHLDGPEAQFEWRGVQVALHLAGRHNVLNALVAAAAAAVVGCDPVDIADALCAAKPPRGRFELVNVGQPFHVAVDYAHTPDALAAVLEAGRESRGSPEGRVLLVFGCGGDRDRAKRGPMGRAAVDGADLVIVTNDNPRSEHPARIIDEILRGIPGGSDHPRVRVEPDRALAIAEAISRARPGDVVVIAGKGHETEQIIGECTVAFDDREAALGPLRSWLEGVAGGGPT
ncbi:MAG: UDP-N-acetylmuramoyl-L-alanyl-D-glutamate--2,6-diaminopimelate ligase [Actinomycetota bacterium]|nr:UDP-N-acetylmuramoyl-L-alanyl-D-glutamate--2,6-diaminopimelate ligase [Actinomycetota bacterium]